MTFRTSTIWTVILVLAQLVVLTLTTAVRVTPLARQFTGWSTYAAMLTTIAIPLLLIAGPFFWRSNRPLAVSSLCVAVAGLVIALSS